MRTRQEVNPIVRLSSVVLVREAPTSGKGPQADGSFPAQDSAAPERYGHNPHRDEPARTMDVSTEFPRHVGEPHEATLRPISLGFRRSR